MKTTDLHLRRVELKNRLLRRLVRRVFHVTRQSSMPAILEAGDIRPNPDGQFPMLFGSTNSYFVNRGCVSVFDYRSATSEQIAASLSQCSALAMAWRGSPITCLFLSEMAQRRLVPPHTNRMTSGKIVLHVEAGHPGPIPMSDIDEILQVTVASDAWDARVERIRQARPRGAQ